MPDFTIVGGYLNIHKSAFAQEMLVQKSILRILLNRQASRDLPNRPPSMDDANGDGMITLNFNNAEAVHLGDDPGELLGALKKKYRGKVRGRITCRGWMSAFTISLDSDDEEIQFIM